MTELETLGKAAIKWFVLRTPGNERALKAAIKAYIRRDARLPLTQRQRCVMAFITKYHAENGLSPAYDDIIAGTGIKSKSEINRIVVALEERGHITRKPRCARSIQILKEAA